MTCLELQERLFDYRTGGLPPAVVSVLERHAAECSCCDELLRTYGLTVDIAAELHTHEVPPHVTEAILRALGG